MFKSRITMVSETVARFHLAGLPVFYCNERRVSKGKGTLEDPFCIDQIKELKIACKNRDRDTIKQLLQYCE